MIRQEQVAYPCMTGLNKTMMGTPSLAFAPGALVASILEILIEDDPDLLSSMREARQSSAGLKTFIRYINSLQPDLYTQLRGSSDELAVANILGQLKRIRK